MEPFLGSGAVFFFLRPERALLGDANGDLICLYKGLKMAFEEVYELLKRHFEKHSRDYYYQVRRARPESTVERAAWFLYLNRACFNGLCRYNSSGEFNVPPGKKIWPLTDLEFLKEVSRVLQGAELWVSDFEVLINAAEEGDFLFVDPP